MTEAAYREFIARYEAENALAEEQYAAKLDRLNERKKLRAERCRAMGIQPYAHKNRKKAPPPTMCINCENSCPNPKKGTGCEWSILFKPVPGWEAIRKDIMLQRSKAESLESYIVISCPKFVKG